MNSQNEIVHIDVESYVGSTSYYDYSVVQTASGSQNALIYFVSVTGGREPPCGFGDGHQGQLNTSNYNSNDYWKRIGDNSWSFQEIWNPSYTSSIEQQPITEPFQFGDGYTQFNEKGLFFSRQKIQAVFQNINNVQTKSLLCFLEWHGSDKPFSYKTSDIYQERRFVVESFKHTYVNFDVNNLNILMLEAEEEN